MGLFFNGVVWCDGDSRAKQSLAPTAGVVVLIRFAAKTQKNGVPRSARRAAIRGFWLD